LFAKEKKRQFVRGDPVIIVKGDLKNLKGKVERVDEESIHIRPDIEGLVVSINDNQLIMVLF